MSKYRQRVVEWSDAILCTTHFFQNELSLLYFLKLKWILSAARRGVEMKHGERKRAASSGFKKLPSPAFANAKFTPYAAPK